MTDRPFDPAADAAANYAEAYRQIRLLTLLRAERWGNEHDEFDLITACDLARLPKDGQGGAPT